MINPSTHFRLVSIASTHSASLPFISLTPIFQRCGSLSVWLTDTLNSTPAPKVFFKNSSISGFVTMYFALSAGISCLRRLGCASPCGVASGAIVCSGAWGVVGAVVFQAEVQSFGGGGGGGWGGGGGGKGGGGGGGRWGRRGGMR